MYIYNDEEQWIISDGVDEIALENDEMSDVIKHWCESNNVIKIELLADYAHHSWSGWMAYLFEKSTLNPDGSVTIPKELVDRWKRQLSTDYKNLPNGEKESDRDEARNILELFLRL